MWVKGATDNNLIYNSIILAPICIAITILYFSNFRDIAYSNFENTLFVHLHNDFTRVLYLAWHKV